MSVGQARRGPALTVLAAVVTVAAVALVNVAQNVDAEAERRAGALSRQLAAQSLAVNATEPVIARRLAAAAWRAAPTTEAGAALAALVAQERGMLVGHLGAVTAVVFSPDGTRLASAGADGTVRIWDTGTAAPLAVLPVESPGSAVNDIAFSPDGTRLASVSEGSSTVRLWDVATGKLVGRPLAGHFRPPDEVAFLPGTGRPAGHRLVTAESDGRVLVRDLVTGGSVDARRQPTEAIVELAVSPDGALVALAGDASVWLWSPVSGRAVRTWVTGGQVRALAFEPDGRHLIGVGGFAGLHRWRVADGQTMLNGLATAAGPSPGVGWRTFQATAVAVSPDGRRVVRTDQDGMLRLWDPVSGRQIGDGWVGHHGAALAVAYHPRGDLVASAGADATIRLWDPATGRQIDPPTGHRDQVYALAFRADSGLLASGDVDGAVRLWNPATGTQVGPTLQAHPGGVTAIAFHPAGRLLATAGRDRELRLWDLTTGRQVRHPMVLTRLTEVRALAFHPNGELLAGAGDANVRLWRIPGLEEVGTGLRNAAGRIWSVAFEPDGQHLVSAGQVAQRWNLATMTPVGDPVKAGHDAMGHWDALAADAGTAASGDDLTQVRVWDLRTRSPIGEIGAKTTESTFTHGEPDAAISAMALDRGAALLATGHHDGGVTLWRIDSRDSRGTALARHDQPVRTVLFSPDGAWLATAGDDGRIGIWDAARLADPYRYLCQRHGAPTAVDWRRFAPGEPPISTCR